MDVPPYTIITAVLGLLVGYYGIALLSSPYRRRRTWGRIRCLMGDHEPGRAIRAVGGRIIQYCERCTKPCREYQVTQAQAKGERDRIRRIR